MPSKKKLKRKLKEARRQCRYAERDARQWCDIVLEQDDAMDTKDRLIADLTKDVESVFEVSQLFQLRNIELEKEIKKLEAPKVTVTDSNGNMSEWPVEVVKQENG